jgi:sporulation protein YlmC with PRC-barrel domain
MNTTMNRTDTNYRRTLSAGTLIGDSVKNAQGEELGTLKEIMLDVERGQIAYGVLETGSFLGMGGKLFAIPFEAFKVDEKDEKLVLNVDKETLKNAEGFDKNNWPDTTSLEWGRKTHQHYGHTPYWERNS